jgi:curved DNA-binding protein CbpA
MVSYASYYNVLGVEPTAGPEEIKQAFRRLALIHHPDKNGNSAQSEAAFKVLNHAREVLADQVKRAEYDAYLATSNTLKTWMRETRTRRPAAAALPPAPDGSPAFVETVLAQLNTLLWDIEDFLRENHETDWNQEFDSRTLASFIINVLAFLDEWILDPAGFPDYFWEARGEARPERRAYFARLRERVKGRGGEWGIFVNMRDYFYNIRRRMNLFIDRATAEDLMKIVPDYDVRILDALFEAQGLAVHNLCFLRSILSGDVEEEAPYIFSNSVFGGGR